MKQLEESVREPIATSLWQYNRNQLNVLIAGLITLPIIEGVDVLDKGAHKMISERTFKSRSVPLSLFESQTDLNWRLNKENIYLGSLTLYSSSEVVLDRVLFGFSLIAIAEIIKLSILFWLFIWAFDRYLATPLKELMSQVDEVQFSQDTRKRINLSSTDNNELTQLKNTLTICYLQ